LSGFNGSFHRAPHQVFDFGEDLLDRIQVRAVGRQKHQMRARVTDHVTHCLSLVAAKIIQHDDVSWFQGFEKFVSDISLEGLAVDWPIEHSWRVDPVTAQRGQEGHCLPMAMRHMGDEPLAAGTPATQRRHVGFDPGLVDEDQTALINLALMGLPSGAVTSELWPQLFSRKNGFF
jgi:hypothetical protein